MLFGYKKLEDVLNEIKKEFDSKEIRIKYLEEENKKLKEKTWKDEQLSKMKEYYDQMQEDYYRGFPISESEQEKIRAWQKKHEEEVHGLTTNKARLEAQGVSGGRYSYHFVPTAIGTSGVVRCSCGAEFEFQEIG